MISTLHHQKNERVVVTALGAVTPLGRGISTNCDALFHTPRYRGETVHRFDISKSRCQTAAHVEPAWLTDIHAPGGRRRGFHHASAMMTASLAEAMENAGTGCRPELCVVGTTSGAMTNGEIFHRSLLSGGPARARAALAANYMPQKPVLDALETCGLRCPIQLVANACSSGANAIGMAFESIRSGFHHCVLAGGYDALSEMVFAGFDALQAATTEICRPFDSERSGLILGEAAAMLIMESETAARARGATILAEIAGYGITTDNHHLTQPEPSGGPTLRAMRLALEQAGVNPSEVDYINAHGTATRFNDATEAAAFNQLGKPGVAVSSTKSLIGHTLGAAGAVEALFSILAIRERMLPPNLNLREPDPGCNFEIIRQPRAARVRTVLSNSLGFGGTNAVLCIREAA